MNLLSMMFFFHHLLYLSRLVDLYVSSVTISFPYPYCFLLVCLSAFLSSLLRSLSLSIYLFIYLSILFSLFLNLFFSLSLSLTLTVSLPHSLSVFSPLPISFSLCLFPCAFFSRFDSLALYFLFISLRWCSTIFHDVTK